MYLSPFEGQRLVDMLELNGHGEYNKEKGEIGYIYIYYFYFFPSISYRSIDVGKVACMHAEITMKFLMQTYIFRSTNSICLGKC